RLRGRGRAGRRERQRRRRARGGGPGGGVRRRPVERPAVHPRDAVPSLRGDTGDQRRAARAALRAESARVGAERLGHARVTGGERVDPARRRQPVTFAQTAAVTSMATAAAPITTAVAHPSVRSQSGFVRVGPMTVGSLVSSTMSTTSGGARTPFTTAH